MGVAIHQTYRPQVLGDLAGQDFIRDTLSKAITRQMVAPAYLFHGPRGTGKTSTARILAKSLNCLESPGVAPCGQCSSCRGIEAGDALDTYEYDCGSNGNVDFIRELKEKAGLKPMQGGRKIIILDEIHQASSAAFSALLKLLEEPPSHCVFILCTTEPDKLPPAIRSRCQSFRFRGLSSTVIAKQLKHIAEAEGLAITDGALRQLAIASNGGLRDSQTLLGSLAPHGEIDESLVAQALGQIPTEALVPIADAVASADAEAILLQVRRLFGDGYEASDILQGISSLYRDLVVLATTGNPKLIGAPPSASGALGAIAKRLEINSLMARVDRLKSAEWELSKVSGTHQRIWLELLLMQLGSLA